MNKNILSLSFLVILITSVSFSTVSAFDYGGGGMFGGGEMFAPGEEEEFFRYLQEEEGMDVNSIFGEILPDSMKTDKQKAANAEKEGKLDRKTLFLTPPTAGEKGDERVALSRAIIGAYDFYTHALIKQLKQAKLKIDTDAFGVERQEFDPYIAMLTTLSSLFASIGRISESIDDNIDYNKYLIEFFDPKHAEIRKMIVDAQDQLTLINDKATLIRETEDTYSVLDPEQEHYGSAVSDQENIL